jgi:hypothetical protein
MVLGHSSWPIRQSILTTGCVIFMIRKREDFEDLIKNQIEIL